MGIGGRGQSHPVVTQSGRSFAALRGASYQFAAAHLYVILGDNGAGKSTLLRIIAGLMQPSQGSVRVLGSDSLPMVAQRVGYMGHAPLLYDELSGMENLRYFAGLYGISDDAICRNAMQKVGLDPELERRIGQYSQGMRQRTSLARVLQTDPELLLLDEPFSNLDVDSSKHMVELLADFRTWPVAGGGLRTIILTTHQSSLAEPIADRIITMRQGQIIDMTTGHNG